MFVKFEFASITGREPQIWDGAGLAIKSCPSLLAERQFSHKQEARNAAAGGKDVVPHE